MAKIRFNTGPIDALNDKLKLTSAEIKKLNKLLNSKLPNELLKILRRHTPKDTGETSKAWEIQKKGGNGFTIVNERGGIIQFLIDGVRPHDIFPKDKSVLMMNIGSSKIFAKFVEHPGYPKQMNVDKIFDEINKATDKVLDRIITDILKRKLK